MATAKKDSLEARVVNDLMDVVKSRWPDAKFRIGEMPEGEGTGIWAYTDADFLEVCDAVEETEFDAMYKSGVLAYVIPMPLEAWED